MKKIKASFKKIVGLKLSDPSYKYWVKVFTKDYSKSSVSIPSKYKDLIRSFYFETISNNAVFSHSKEIEENPLVSLPIYLKLNQNIKNQYFEFCENFKKEYTRQTTQSTTQYKSSYQQPSINNFEEIMEVVVPHLIRFAIGFTYQLERNLPFLLNGDNPKDASIIVDQIQRFTVIHETIIRCGIEKHINDYVTYILTPLFEVLSPILQRLFTKSSGNKDQYFAMRNFSLGLANPLVDLFIDMNGKEKVEEFWNPCFIFISKISICALPFSEKETHSLILGSIWVFSMENLPEAAKIPSLAFASQTLIYLTYSGIKENSRKSDNNETKIKINQNQANEILKNALSIGAPTFKIIENQTALQSWSDNSSSLTVDEKTIVLAIFDYIKTLFYSLLSNESLSIVDQKLGVIDLGEKIINEMNFTKENLIYINKGEKKFVVSAPKRKTFVDFPPSLLKLNGGETVKQIYSNLKNITYKYTNITEILCEKILDEFKDNKKNLFSIFFTFLTFKFMPPSIVSAAIVRRNSWNFLLNDKVLLPLVKFDFDLADIVEEVSISCFASSFDNQYSVIEAVSSLFFTSSVSRALTIIEQMIVIFPNKFIREIGKGSFIDIIFRCESSIRQTLLNSILNKTKTNASTNSFSHDDLLKLRVRFFSLIRQISLLDASQIIYPKERCLHILSLFFELPIQSVASQVIVEGLLCRGKEQFVIECIIEFLSATINMAFDSDWQNMVIKIVNVIFGAVAASYTVGISIVETSLILTLHKAVREITEKENKPAMYEFCLSILSFISSLCSCNDEFLRGLISHSTQWEFRSTWMNFFLSDWDFSKTKNTSNSSQKTPAIRDTDVDLLWKLALLGDETTIRNIEGLWLLVSATKNTRYFIEVIRKLIEMCKFSLINRFQCSQSDIIITILDVYTGDNDQRSEIIELIKNIGYSFFTPSELSEFFTKVQMKQSIKLIDLFSDIIQETCNNKFNGIRSFFHIGPLPFFTQKILSPNSTSSTQASTSKFIIDSAKIDFRPKIMFFVRFGKNCEKKTFKFLSISLNGTAFHLSIDINNLNLVLKNGPLNITIPKKIELLIWVKFSIFIGKNDIIIYINDQEFHRENKIKLPPSITSLSVTIGGIDCNIESVAIAKDNNTNFGPNNNSNLLFNSPGLAALYSARVLEGGVCLNVFQGGEYNFQSALFNGIGVPYTINIINTISNSGGVRILLPLFEIIRKTSNLCLIRAVESLIKNHESMFIDQSFFKALSGILPDRIPIDFFKIFTDLYRNVKISELKTEMLINIFGNWNLLQRVDSKDHNTYIRLYLPIVLGSQPELFTSTFTIKTFFTPILLENEYVWQLIEKFCTFQFTNDDFVSMLTAAVDNSVSSVFAINALKTILSAIDKHDKVIDMLKDFDYFEPFFPVFQNFVNEDIWLPVFQIFDVISTKRPDSNASARLLNCFSIIDLSIITEKTLNQIISIIFSNEKSSTIQHIKNSQFIPFLCFILPCFPSTSTEKVAKMIYDSILVYDITSINIVNCSLWQFWLLYLSNFYKTTEDWIALIAKIPIEPSNWNEYYTELESLFFIYSEIADIKFQKMMLNYLSALMNKPSLELVVESFKYIFFNPKRNNKRFSFPPELIRDLKQLSKIINSMLIDWSPSFALSIRFDTLASVSGLDSVDSESSKSSSAKWLDFDLAQKCIDYLLSNKGLVSRNVQFSDSTIPLSYLLTFAVHIISISDFNYACSILPKILTVPAIKMSKPLLAFLLIDFNGVDYKAQTEIGKIICPSSLSNDNEKSFKPIQLPSNIEAISLMDVLAQESIKYQKYFDATREKTVSKLMSMLEQTYNQDLVRKVILPKFNEILNENSEKLARIIRRNHRIWTSISLELVKDGAIWSTVSSEGLHWKFSQLLDGVGRKNQMKINRHFDSHIDASQARDNEKVDPSIRNTYQNAKIFERKFKLETILDKNEEAQNNSDKDNKVAQLKSATFKFECTLVTINAYYKGTLYFMRGMISFESYETTDEFGQKKESCPKFVDIRLSDALYIIKRRFLHQKIGAEVFTNKRRGYFFIFESRDIRSKFMSKMTFSGVKLIKKVDEFTAAWKSGRLTNYEYIFWLNMLGGRSFNDIAQYPIFPWILSDYSSPSINLRNPNVYRDLTKPIGALNAGRLEDLNNTYNEMKKEESSLPVPISLYRLHYSTPGYVIYFLIRSEPFTSLHVELQGGKFDHSSRLFSSLEQSYNSVVSSNPDYRELIPEFFSTNEFLINSNHFDLGKNVNDVVLPKWSRNTSHFIAMNKVALESPIVSLMINNWIDLVFGYKQQDIKYANLFHPYSDPYYFDNADKSRYSEILLHAANFGVNPSKLFNHPHPKRSFIPHLPNFEEPQLMKFTILARKTLADPIMIWTRINHQSANQVNEKINSLTESFSSSSMSPTIASQIFQSLNNSLPSPQCELFALVSTGSLVSCQLPYSDSEKSKKPNSDVQVKSVSKLKLKFQNVPCNLTFDFVSHFTSLIVPHGLFYLPPTSSLMSGLTSTPSFSCDFINKETNSIVDSGIVVAASPWSSSFDIIDAARGKIIFSSSEDAMLSSITAIAADGSYVVTGAQDASLCVWNIAKQRMTALIRAHEHKVNCIAYNDVCNLIASVDNSGKFSYSSVRSGSFTRSIILEEFQNVSKKADSLARASNCVLTKIEISTLGYVILFSEERNLTDVTTVLDSYDFSQRKIETSKIPGRVTSTCLCVFQDDSQYAFVAMSTLKVFLYNVTELTRRAAYGEVSSPVKSSTFCRERSELLLALENGDLLSYRFV